MRIFTAIAIALSLIAISVATTIEGGFAILFGWISFLGRVVPQAQPDGPSVVVGSLALLLFGAGVHWIGRSSHRPAGADAKRWRVKWTVAVLVGVVLLFTAGISVVGMTHQVAWLATSDQPVVGEGLKRRGDRVLNAKVIGMGLENYSDTHNTLPEGGTFSANGEMLHSWETRILPYMSYSTYGIDMKRPWNGPENRQSFRCIIPEFINPEFRTPPLEDAEGYGLSHYAANSRVLSADKSMKYTEFTKGTSNTILVGEVNGGFKPWGHPINWRDPAAGLNRGATTFGGPAKANSTMFLMADGSVRFVGNGVDPTVLRALSDPRAKD